MRLTYRQASRRDIESMGPTREKMVGMYIEGMTWAAVMGEQVVFVIGHVPFWTGTTTVWMHVKDDALLPPMQTVKLCKELMDSQLCNYRRVQAYVDSKSVVNNKFIKAIGFELESVMVEGNPNGGDYNVYRRQ